MKNKSITLNGIELKRVFRCEPDLPNRQWIIEFQYDKRISLGMTDLVMLSDFKFKNIPSAEEEIGSIVLFIPMDSTSIEIKRNQINQI